MDNFILQQLLQIQKDNCIPEGDWAMGSSTNNTPLNQQHQSSSLWMGKILGDPISMNNATMADGLDEFRAFMGMGTNDNTATPHQHHPDSSKKQQPWSPAASESYHQLLNHHQQLQNQAEQMNRGLQLCQSNAVINNRNDLFTHGQLMSNLQSQSLASGAQNTFENVMMIGTSNMNQGGNSSIAGLDDDDDDVCWIRQFPGPETVQSKSILTRTTNGGSRATTSNDGEERTKPFLEKVERVASISDNILHGGSGNNDDDDDDDDDDDVGGCCGPVGAGDDEEAASFSIGTMSGHGRDRYAENGILGPWSARAAGLLGNMMDSGNWNATSDNNNDDGNPAKKSSRRRRKQQPKDRPKRPLSAYNIFFQEERSRILQELPSKQAAASSDDVQGENDEKRHGTTASAADVQSRAGRAKRNNKKAAHGKIGFECLAKMIGQRWKNLHEDETAGYKAKAREDMERYRHEMEVYNSKKGCDGKSDLTASVQDNRQEQLFHQPIIDAATVSSLSLSLPFLLEPKPIREGTLGCGVPVLPGEYPRLNNGAMIYSAPPPSVVGCAAARDNGYDDDDIDDIDGMESSSFLSFP